MHKMFKAPDGITICVSDEPDRIVSAAYAFLGEPDDPTMEKRLRKSVDEILDLGPIVAMLICPEPGALSMHYGPCAENIYEQAKQHGHEIFEN